MNTMQLPVSKCNILTICLGAVLIIAGVSLLCCVSYLHESIITSSLEFAPNSTVYVAWKKPNDPIIMDIYFFNWTNPEDINNPNIKPKFVEMGPYRYKQFKEKTNISWVPENDTISFKYLKYFYFDEENSPCHHSDYVTTINIVAYTTAQITHDWNLVLKIFTSVDSSEIYVRKNVSELLFDGYEDPMLKKKGFIPFFGDDIRFGWFYGRNGTIGSDGAYNMKITPDESYGTLQTWEYSNETKFYDSGCNKIYGSGGELYPRNVKPSAIKLFSPEMCRSAQFNFEKNVTVKGLDGYKFSAGYEVFDNGSTIKENKCFNTNLPLGVLNISSCRNEAPIYLSLPHFYFADSSYLNAVDGMHPIKDKHELYVTLEPNTGILADISARMQINVFLQPLPNFKLYKNIPEVMFPVLWFDQNVVMGDELASGLTLLLFTLPLVLEIIFLIAIIAGIFSIIGVVLFITCYKQKASNHIVIREEIPLNSKL